LAGDEEMSLHGDKLPDFTETNVFLFVNFEWIFLAGGHIVESLEAADANLVARWARPRKARWHPSTLTTLKNNKEMKVWLNRWKHLVG